MGIYSFAVILMLSEYENGVPMLVTVCLLFQQFCVTESMRENVCLGKIFILCLNPLILCYTRYKSRQMHAYVVILILLQKCCSAKEKEEEEIYSLQTFYHLRQSLWNWHAHQKIVKIQCGRVMHASDNLYLTDFIGDTKYVAIVLLSHSANYFECCHGCLCFFPRFCSYKKSRKTATHTHDKNTDPRDPNIRHLHHSTFFIIHGQSWQTKKKFQRTIHIPFERQQKKNCFSFLLPVPFTDNKKKKKQNEWAK